MNDFYVYRYIRLDTQMPFYVGKGKDKRAELIKKHNVYCQRIADKCGHEVEYVLTGLSSEAAYIKEKEFILLYKSLGYCEANIALGGNGPVGVKLTKETRKQMSLSKLGPLNYWYGKKLSPEHLKKCSDANIGKMTYGDNPRARPVIDTNTGISYSCIKEAAEKLNINATTLYCRLTSKYSDKYHIKFR